MNIIVKSEYINEPVKKPILANKATVSSAILAGMKIIEMDGKLIASNGSLSIDFMATQEDNRIGNSEQYKKDLQTICKSAGHTLVSSEIKLTAAQMRDSRGLIIDPKKAEACKASYVGLNLGGVIVSEQDKNSTPTEFEEYRNSVKQELAVFKGLAPKYGYTPEMISDISSSIANNMKQNATRFYSTSINQSK